MQIELETLSLKPGCHMECKGWGGSRNREIFSEREALMILDTELRTIEIVPLGRGEGAYIPLENARQWRPKQQKKPTTRAGAATSAKASA